MFFRLFPLNFNIHLIKSLFGMQRFFVTSIKYLLGFKLIKFAPPHHLFLRNNISKLVEFF